MTNIQAVDRRIASVNPASGEVLKEFESASESEVQAVVLRARAAQPAWKELGVRKRVAILLGFLRILHERKSEIARLITSEAGKPVVEALLTEVLVVLDAARFCVENAYAILRDQPVPHRNLAMKTKSGRLVRESYGVIGIISPWNYPFSIPATETLAALVAGNAVVLKPSELTPQCSLRLAELLHEAGVPEDVFQVVVGDGSTGAALVNAKIDKLVFTGSVSTGKRIAQAAAARLLPVVLELGGKDPMIVLDDADVDVASSAAVWERLSTRVRLVFRWNAATCIGVSIRAFWIWPCKRPRSCGSETAWIRKPTLGHLFPSVSCELWNRTSKMHWRGKRGCSPVESVCMISARISMHLRCSPTLRTRCSSCGKKLLARCCR